MDFEKDHFDDETELSPLEEEEAGDSDEIVETEEEELIIADDDADEVAAAKPASKPAAKAATKAAAKKPAAKAALKAKPKKAAKKPASAREGSKKAEVLELLRRRGGCTLAEIMKATDWQAHTVRGFISGTLGKKMGLTVASTKSDSGERTYSVTR